MGSWRTCRREGCRSAAHGVSQHQINSVQIASNRARSTCIFRGQACGRRVGRRSADGDGVPAGAIAHLLRAKARSRVGQPGPTLLPSFSQLTGNSWSRSLRSRGNLSCACRVLWTVSLASGWQQGGSSGWWGPWAQALQSGCGEAKLSPSSAGLTVTVRGGRKSRSNRESVRVAGRCGLSTRTSAARLRETKPQCSAIAVAEDCVLALPGAADDSFLARAERRLRSAPTRRYTDSIGNRSKGVQAVAEPCDRRARGLDAPFIHPIAAPIAC